MDHEMKVAIIQGVVLLLSVAIIGAGVFLGNRAADKDREKEVRAREGRP